MGEFFVYNLPSAAAVGSKASRQRQYHHKTKTGCNTCRHRRLKCDEIKPTCQRCHKANRTCTWAEAPRANIFEPSTTTSLQSTPAKALTVPGPPADKRALQFYMEQTAPVMSTFQDLTRAFWEVVVPQLAATESSVRHITIALACRQEKASASSEFGTHREDLQAIEREHYAASLSCLTRGSTVGDMEILLVASTLFIAYGNFENLEQQTAQDLQHFSSGLKILVERAKNPEHCRRSEIIDKWVQPMLVRLEVIYSVFMAPRDPGRYAVIVEPGEAVLPGEFSSIFEARESFVEICCYRHHHHFRNQSWNYQSTGFLTIRLLLLRWHGLVLAYQSRPEKKSEAEQQRVAVMLSQFRLLFIALVYSARTDLHSIEDHVSPAVIALLKHNQVSMTYDLPERYIQLLPGLDWESRSHQDPLQVRLWPVAQVTSIRKDTASLSLTFYV